MDSEVLNNLRDTLPPPAASPAAQTIPTQQKRYDASGFANRNFADYMRMLCAELGRFRKSAEETLTLRQNLLQSNNHHMQDLYAQDFELAKTSLHYNLDRCYRLLEQAEMQLRIKPFE